MYIFKATNRAQSNTTIGFVVVVFLGAATNVTQPDGERARLKWRIKLQPSNRQLDKMHLAFGFFFRIGQIIVWRWWVLCFSQVLLLWPLCVYAFARIRRAFHRIASHTGAGIWITTYRRCIRQQLHCNNMRLLYICCIYSSYTKETMQLLHHTNDYAAQVTQSPLDLATNVICRL